MAKQKQWTAREQAARRRGSQVERASWRCDACECFWQRRTLTAGDRCPICGAPCHEVNDNAE